MDNTNKATMWFIGGFLVLVIVGVTAAYMASGGSSAANSGQSATTPATTVPAISAGDWTEGNKAAKVSVIEYGDYECPACGSWSPIVDQLVKDYGSEIVYSFRNFPLYQIHPDAQISSEAAEAAGLQGKYWEMHELLYKNQAAWSVADPGTVVSKYFDGYAGQLGLDVKKFDQDINSSAVSNKIQADVAGGNAAQIDHTPTFFVNLTQIPNPTDYNAFKAVIDQALAAASSTK